MSTNKRVRIVNKKTAYDDLLERYLNEVFFEGITACLPQNLSDQWLTHLDHEMDKAGHGGDYRISLMTVMGFLQVRNCGHPVKISLKDLEAKLNNWHGEIKLEIMRRAGEVVTVALPTLETILEDRYLGYVIVDQPDGTTH